MGKNAYEKARDAIRQMVADQVPVQTRWVKVKSVDKAENVCTCESVRNGLEYFDVLLSLGDEDITIVPKVGSKALMGIIENIPTANWLLRVEQVDFIKLHGDKFGGLVKLEELVKDINNLKSDYNTLKNLMLGWTPVPADGGAALKVLLATWLGTGVVLSNVGTLENTKVTHG
jgi:hypothetical protein